MKETGCSFSFFSLYWWVLLPPLLEWVFSAMFQVLIEIFSYCTLTETFAIASHKWFEHEWIDFGVFWKMAFFVDLISVWTEICKICSIFFLFWRHQLFSMFRLRGILVSSSKLFYFLAMGFCKIKWWALGMQCNFPYYSFVSSSLFLLEVVVKLFDYFWQPNSLFSKFCVNCILMFYFVYRKTCVLNDVNGACWCICSLVVLRKPHMCFWPAIEENFKFQRCIHVFDLVLKIVSDLNEGNWWQLLFYFLELMGIVTAVIGIRFLSAVFHVFDWRFLVLHFDWNVCNWFQKWYDHEWIDFVVFCWKMASFVEFISVGIEIC